MKNHILLLALVFSSAMYSQSVPMLEQYGNMVKATYYNEDGKIQQQGFFKDGKLEGQWVSYDQQGNKKAVAEYDAGAKTGQWVFWNDRSLTEVAYSDSRVASVKTWKEDALVKN